MATLKPFPSTPSPARTPTSNPPLPSVREYYERPLCSDAHADAAYQNYLRQSTNHGHDFSHWLEREAWQRTGRSS